MPERSVSTNAALQLGQPASAMVDARSDLFSSGAPAVDRDRGGVLPATITLAPGGGVLTFSDVRGRIGCMTGSHFQADGGDCVGGDTSLNAAGFVSGLVAHERSLFLSGVFLDDRPGPAPAGLDFSQRAIGMSFAELSPRLGQSFFIGDGRTGTDSGSAQHFRIRQGVGHGSAIRAESMRILALPRGETPRRHASGLTVRELNDELSVSVMQRALNLLRGCCFALASSLPRRTLRWRHEQSGQCGTRRPSQQEDRPVVWGVFGVPHLRMLWADAARQRGGVLARRRATDRRRVTTPQPATERPRATRLRAQRSRA